MEREILITNIKVIKGEGVIKDNEFGVKALRYSGDFKDCKTFEEANEEWGNIILASDTLEKSNVHITIEVDGEAKDYHFCFKVEKDMYYEWKVKGLRKAIIELLEERDTYESKVLLSAINEQETIKLSYVEGLEEAIQEGYVKKWLLEYWETNKEDLIYCGCKHLVCHVEDDDSKCFWLNINGHEKMLSSGIDNYMSFLVQNIKMENIKLLPGEEFAIVKEDCSNIEEMFYLALYKLKELSHISK